MVNYHACIVTAPDCHSGDSGVCLVMTTDRCYRGEEVKSGKQVVRIRSSLNQF